MKRFVAGVDGSTASLHALSWAAHLANAVGSELVVVAVYGAGAGGTWAEDHQAMRERLEQQWCEPARQIGASYRAELLDGEAGPALAAGADAEEADLVVISTRGRGGFTGLLVGSVADYVAHHVDRPLAIVPPGCPVDPPARAVLALDGSRGAASAAAWWAPMAAALYSEVVAATVLTPPDPLAGSIPSRRRQVQEALDTIWTEPLRQAGVRVRTRVMEDRHPASALMDLAGIEQAGALVAGTRALHGLRMLRLGGVTMHLLHHSSLPVIVVPPDTTEDNYERWEVP